MNTLYRLLVCTLFTTLLVGCCSCRSKRHQATHPLVGTEWQLIRLGGEQFTPADGQYTLQLLADEGQLTGVGACNRLTGRYTEGERRALQFTQLASTRMLCPDAEQEAGFFTMLETVTHYDQDGAMLLLFSNGDLVAVLQAQSAE